MNNLDLSPIKRAQGVVTLPGSKSISNRILLLSALAQGNTSISGLLDADDTQVMRDALIKLGVVLEPSADSHHSDIINVQGTGGTFPIKQTELFLGNAGTAFRPLSAALALADGHYRLSGVPRMHERPIGDLVDALRPLGAHITYLQNDHYPPLAIAPRQRTTASAQTSVRGDVSSQFLSALLMALPLITEHAAGKITVDGELISKPYVEITLNLMRQFGVEVQRDQWQTFTVAQGQSYRSPGRIMVEGDASSASYFLALGALAQGPVKVQGVGRNSIQGDIRFVDVLQKMGAQVVMDDDSISVRGINVLAGERLMPINADFNHIPDAAMTVAILALFAEGPSTLRNIASWRVKETDRIAAMSSELRKLGAKVDATNDALHITPPTQLLPAAIDTYDDHRMAMCFSLTACGGVNIRIHDAECVNKTFPEYFSVLAQLVCH